MSVATFFRYLAKRGHAGDAVPVRRLLAGLVLLAAAAVILASAYPTGGAAALLEDDIGIERSLAPDDGADAPHADAVIPGFAAQDAAFGHPVAALGAARAHFPDSFLVPYANGPPAAA